MGCIFSLFARNDLLRKAISSCWVFWMSTNEMNVLAARPRGPRAEPVLVALGQRRERPTRPPARGSDFCFPVLFTVAAVSASAGS